MSRALLIVDVQNDFTEGGALAVPGGDEVATRISNLLIERGSHWGLIVASRDFHEPDSDNEGHFGNPPDFVDSWPSHCIMGTAGAGYDSLLSLPRRTVHVEKGQGKPAYSAFEGVADVGWESRLDLIDLDKLLVFHEISAVDIVGIALDYCVKQTALDAQRRGLKTIVHPKFCASVNPDNNPTTIYDLVTNGVSVSGWMGQ